MLFRSVTAPPEQFGYGQTDIRSDIYSLGTLLFYLFQKNFNINSHSLSTIPEDFARIIRKCTTFSPEMLYRNTNELKDKLQKLFKKLKYIENKKVFQTHYYRLAGLSALLFLFFLAGLWEIRQLRDSLSYYEAPVTLNSPKLEEAVRKELGLSSTAPITLYDLQHIYHIAVCGDMVYDENTPYEYEIEENRLDNRSCNEKGSIHDLTDLTLMKNLTSLSLPNQIITDITPIENLPLKELVLSANSISDFSPIAGMTGLDTLIIGGNKATDYTFLKNLTALKTLNLDKAQLTDLNFLKDYDLAWLSLNSISLKNADFSPISTQKSLQELRIENCSTDITPYINQLKGLAFLRYSGSRIASLDELDNLTQLVQLHLHNTTLSSLQDISLFPHLNYLGLVNTRVTDISPIADLKELRGLDITGCYITDYGPVKKLRLDNLWCTDEQRLLIEKLP